MLDIITTLAPGSLCSNYALVGLARILSKGSGRNKYNTNQDIFLSIWFLFQIINALTSIKPVNKTDAMTLISIFGTLENMIKTSETKLSNCPGFGTRKASKLYGVLHEPFLKKGLQNQPIISYKTAEDEFDDNIDLSEIEALLKNKDET